MIFILLLKCPDLKYKSLSYNAGLRLRELADSEAVLRAVLLGAAQTSSRRAGAGKSTDPPPPKAALSSQGKPGEPFFSLGLFL